MPESPAPDVPKQYRIGVMKIPVEERDAEFDRTVEAAVRTVRHALTQEEMHLRVDVVEFSGPHLSPSGGAYSPLDFLHIGLSENVTHGFHFLLMVTEVDLAPLTQPYVLALPSQLTNVGILSTKRLSPQFWGETESEAVTTQRLAALMLHTLGHLLNLSHQDDAHNIMYDVSVVEDLDKMTQVTREQVARIKRNLPLEARDKLEKEHPWRFALRQSLVNWRSIWHAVRRANPLHLALQLPTMITTAISVVIVIFFSAEIWDIASTVEFYQLLIFGIVAMVVATMVLYRAFTFGAISTRTKAITETAVVTEAATLLSLLLTMLVLYVGFFALTYLGTISIFPRQLMESWPTVDPATRAIDHVRLSLFLAAMGVLAGSLGGRAEGREIVRQVIFLDEET